MCGLGYITIAAIPQDVLLDIFDFCQPDETDEMNLWWVDSSGAPLMWYTLAHVCRSWRDVVLASPIRLNLFLRCTGRTPVREMLDTWPPLPLIICSDESCIEDNIIAALAHRDRVCRISLKLTSPQLERFIAEMQEPFPALTHLWLESDDILPALPDMLLGGSAPRLQDLDWRGVPFPTLPKLLLSTNDLVTLGLWEIPDTGYISPEAMVTCLFPLTRLESLSIEFKSPASRPDPRARRPPPLTPAVLPSLAHLRFHGVSEYLEDLVARIDAPQLHSGYITFFNQLVFDLRQLPRFISHAGMLRELDHARVDFSGGDVEMKLEIPTVQHIQWLKHQITCDGVEWQVSSMAQICNQLSFLLSNVQQLDVFSGYNFPTLEIDTDNEQWLEFLQPFTAVRTLRISHRLQSPIMSALQELTGEVTTQVLPALNSLYLEEYERSRSEQQALDTFITARQQSGHPVAIHRLEERPSSVILGKDTDLG
jgi:F-box-like